MEVIKLCSALNFHLLSLIFVDHLTCVQKYDSMCMYILGDISLPSDIQTASSLTTFKNLLKTYLFIQSYYST